MVGAVSLIYDVTVQMPDGYATGEK